MDPQDPHDNDNDTPTYRGKEEQKEEVVMKVERDCILTEEGNDKLVFTQRSTQLLCEDSSNREGEPNEQQVKLRWNMRHTAQKPVRALGELCGVWIGLMLLLALLSPTVGMIEFEIEVPFYDRAEVNQERWDAYKATERDADFVSTFGQAATGACLHDDPTLMTRNGTLLKGSMPTKGCQRSTNHFFRLVYISKDRASNILTQDNLRQIQSIEETFLNTLEVTRHCLLVDSTYPAFVNRNIDDIVDTMAETVNDEPQFVACERINSVLNFLDPLYFDRQEQSGLGYYLLPNGTCTTPRTYSPSWSYLTLLSILQTQIKCLRNTTTRRCPKSFRIGKISILNRTTCRPMTFLWLRWARVLRFKISSGESLPPSTHWDPQKVRPFHINGMTKNEIAVLKNTNISTAFSVTAIGLTSTYSLGLPISGYESSTTDKEDQWTDTGEFLWNKFDSFLKSANFDGVEVYWSDSENGMVWAEESKSEGV